MFYPLSKLQKKDHARILRGALPPAVLKRLAEREKAASDARALAEVEATERQVALVMASVTNYQRTLPERIKAESAKRFKNGVA